MTVQADPDMLAKKVLGMPGGEKPPAPEEPSGELADEVDSEGEALDALAADAASEMGLAPDKAPALAAFGRAILRLARGED